MAIWVSGAGVEWGACIGAFSTVQFCSSSQRLSPGERFCLPHLLPPSPPPTAHGRSTSLLPLHDRELGFLREGERKREREGGREERKKRKEKKKMKGKEGKRGKRKAEKER